MNIRKKIIKNIFQVIGFSIVFCSIGSTTVTVLADTLAPDRVTGVTTEPTQYVGYGYNIAGGKAIYENDALMLNNPILDTESEIIQKNIKVFDGSKTEYQNNSFTRRSELAENYGKMLSGGLSVNAKVAAVNLDVDAKFSNSTAENWSNIATEEFSYYTIFAGNRPVVLQMDPSSLHEHLSDRFENDLYNVANENDAINLFNKYGTHLLTGYTLGGIFEMTNYYATNSSEYVKENETSFEAQVGMALGSYAGGGGDFSFTNNFGYKDNNQYATNQYKCTTYGGLSFPGLTIDQAFSWYETLSSSGYVYQLWTDSINAGKNLVIVSIPQSSKMIPLWQLLPVTVETNEIKTLLIDAYAKITKDAYVNYKDNNKDHFLTGIENVLVEDTDFVFEEKGFTYMKPLESQDENESNSDVASKTYTTSYIDANTIGTTTFDVVDQSYIQMDYDYDQFVGQKAEWVVEGVGSAEVDIVDSRNGIFKIDKQSEDDNAILSFRIRFKVNGINLFSRFFKIKDKGKFSGGDGSENSPYLISTFDDLNLYCSNPEYWNEGVHAALTNDIDCEYNGVYRTLDIIGSTYDNVFSGIFDGNNYTIYNYRSTKSVKSDYGNSNLLFLFGMFGINKGIIKNLTMDYYDVAITVSGIEAVLNDNSQIYASGLCCSIANVGKIENCVVNNLNMLCEKNEDQAEQETIKQYVGAVSAASQGIILNSHAENIEFSFKTNEQLNQDTHIGGITGSLAYETGSIDKCSVNKFDINISADCKMRSCIIGGIAAYLSEADLTNVLVKEMNINLIGRWSGSSLNMGGIVGWVGNSSNEKKVEISYAAVVNSCGLGNVNDDSLGNGVFIGYIDSTSVVEFSNCYRNCNCGKDTNECHTNGMYRSDIDAEIVRIPGQINKNSVSSLLTDEETWIYTTSNNLSIRKIGINKDTLTLDCDNAQKNFYEGESFKSNGLLIKGAYNNGDEFETENYLIDFSDYKTEKGIYSINVIAYGVTMSYDVTVGPVEGYSIYVEEVEKKTYYVHDNVEKFDRDSVKVHFVSTNGTDIVLDNNKYQMILNNKTFKEGSNEIIFKYEGFEYSFYVDAIKRDIKEIKVKDETIPTNEFNVGSRDIDLAGLKVEVCFANDEKMIVDQSECDFIYATIQEGQNVITVAYEVEYTATFEVRGKYIVSQQLIDNFVAAVNAIEISKDLTMVEMYKNIQTAIMLYKEIGYDFKSSGNKEFNDALDKLEESIDEYNLLADEINTSFGNGVEIASGISGTILMNTGYTLLGAMILFLLKLI